jgi:hypothetical protein
MRSLLTLLSCLSSVANLAAASDAPRVLLDNDRVRAIRVGTARAIADYPAAVVVPLEGASLKLGEAYWSGDRGAAKTGPGDVGSFIIIALKEPPLHPPTPPPVEGGSAPGQAPFIGMSFKPLFANDRVAVIRGRMEIGATEGFHTHAADVVLVHLSGGVIEDTADGRTKVNHWKHGDVEFEARGSSHSARNLGQAVDAVLVTLKP